MTLGFRLTLKELPDGRLSLSVPVVYRLLLAAIGLLILLAVVLTAPGEERRLFVPANTVPLIIGFLSLLGGAYHERWSFDRPGDEVTHRFGLAFVGTTRRYKLSELAELELEGIRRNPEAGQRGGGPDRSGARDGRGRAPAGAGAPYTARDFPQNQGPSGLPRGLFFRRGPIVTLWLNGKDGSTHRLETYAPSQGGRAVDTAREIADYCGLPLRGA
jgi:hypothetical protein